jgi:hypothetical protein
MMEKTTRLSAEWEMSMVSIRLSEYAANNTPHKKNFTAFLKTLNTDNILILVGRLYFGELFEVNFGEGCVRSMKCNVEFCTNPAFVLGLRKPWKSLVECTSILTVI